MDLWDNHPKLIERIDPIFDLPFKAEYVDVVTPTCRQVQELKTYLRTPLLFVHRRKVMTGILYHAKPMDDTEEHLMVSYLTEWFQASIDGLVETVMYNRNGEHVASTYPVFPRDDTAKNIVDLQGEIICSDDEEHELFDRITEGEVLS